MKKEHLQSAHKSKVSFFRPGRLVKDDEESYVSDCYAEDGIKPDPLNVRNSVAAPINPSDNL